MSSSDTLKNIFSPQYFFELSIYKHAKIFDDCPYVWQALSKISLYLREANLGLIETDIPETAYLINPELISIGKGTVVEPGAYIKGPCIIGEQCTIRHGAYIRGDVVTGNHCVIGHDTEIKNAILLNHAHAAHFAYVGDSILGNEVNLGAGTKCANLKLDESSINIHYDGEKVPTGLRKFGAIIGDASQLGCNSVTNPGTLLGRNCHVYPCTNFGGVFLSNQLIKTETKILAIPHRY